MKVNNLLINMVLLVISVSAINIKAETNHKKDENYRAALASPEGQIWTLEAWRYRLGKDSQCIHGTDWIFYDDGRLVKKVCDNEQVSEKKHRWSLSSKTTGPIELSIDSKVYWIEILKDKIDEPGYPPIKVLIAKIQEYRESQEESVKLYELRRTYD